MFPEMSWQPSLFGGDGEVGIDADFTGLRRRELDDTAWLDFAPGWLSGSDLLFPALLADTP